MDTTDLDDIYPLTDREHMLGSGGAGGAGPLPAGLLDRAQGCLLGQLAGDSLGSLVEFKDAGTIRALFPAGVRDLADGGTWDTLAGQPTDDSEMALMLARSVIRAGRYEQAEAAVAYARWFASPPFDCGRTTAKALSPAAQALARGEAPAAVAAVAASAADPSSQANGALMRVSPLGVFGHAAPAVAAEWARQDAVLTHPHPVCSAANAAFIAAIATAVSRGADAEAVHSAASTMAAGPAGHPAVEECLSRAARRPPDDYSHRQGWVLTALGNAFWQLLHSKTLEEGVCDTVMRGGDADTNAAIAGALLGAVHGASAVPARWRDRLLACRPERGRPGVRRPRPRAFWPVDCLLVAERLVELGRDVDPKK